MIAIIAGTGTLPVQACQKLLETKQPFFVLALFPDDNLSLLQTCLGGRAELIAQPFYKVGKILGLLKERKAKKVLFVGKVDKQHLLSHMKLDWLAVKLLASLASRSDSSIMERLLNELASHGIDVMRQDEVLDSLLVPPGVLCGKIDQQMQDDINIGMHVATQMSCCDIGQTVVVKDKMILAVEAIEGTDACIKRGIDLGKTGIVICKSARASQNRKYDLPTLGPKSLESIKQGEVKVIAWLSSSTFIAQQEKFIKLAESLNITLVSVKN